MTAPRAVIEVEHLHKRYRDTVAVEDVSFTVGQGEIVGIIGPNGAGKTTTVETIEGLRTPDRGTPPGQRACIVVEGRRQPADAE